MFLRLYFLSFRLCGQNSKTQQVSHSLGHLSCIIPSFVCGWDLWIRWDSQAIDFGLCQRWWVVSPVITLCYRRLEILLLMGSPPVGRESLGGRGNFRASWRWQQPARQGSQAPKQGSFPLSWAHSWSLPAPAVSHLFNTPNPKCLLRSRQWLPIPERPGPRALIWFSASTKYSYASISPPLPPAGPSGQGPFSELDIILSSLGSCSLSKAFPFPPRKSPSLNSLLLWELQDPWGRRETAGRSQRWGRAGNNAFGSRCPTRQVWLLPSGPRPRPSLGRRDSWG